jgi:hypothetical protein
MESHRVICECNLNINTDKPIEEKEKDFSNEEEDDGNFITYFIDKVNYKIFKCYNLILDINNLYNNIAFYIILGIFTLILLLSFSFLYFGIKNIRKQMHREIPTEEKVKDMIIKELKKIKDSNNNLLSNHLKRKKNKMHSINSFSTSKNIRLKKKFRSNIIRKNTINLNKDKKIENITENKNKSQDELNNLPFTQALRIDKRNIFQIFISILFQKLELIKIFLGNSRIRIICICEYILSLLFDFFSMHYFILMKLYLTNIIIMVN